MSSLSRREFLRLSGTAIAGLALEDFFPLARALAGEKLDAPELLREFEPSIYPAGDNTMGRIDGGAVVVNAADFNDYYKQAMQQFRDYPRAAYQDYAVSMEATFLPTQSDGSPRLPRYPEIYRPDFWLKEGWGLGFDETTLAIHGTRQVLEYEIDSLLTASPDGISRGHFIIPQEELWHVMIHSLRSIYQIRSGGSLDLKKYGPKTDLAKLDAELLKEFRRSVDNVGYERARSTRWPGPVDLNKVGYNIVGDGRVCIAKRPKNSVRENQVPELFSEAWYREWVEKSTSVNDERSNLVDTRSHVELLVLFDPNSPKIEDSYRFVVLGDDSPVDSLRPSEQHGLADDSSEKVRVRRARWVPCGKPKPGPEATPSQSPSPQPTGTLKPGETPQPPQQPPQPPAEITPAPPVPPNTPGAHESTPESGVPTVVPPGPQPTGQPTFIPQSTESAGNATEMVPTPDY